MNACLFATLPSTLWSPGCIAFRHTFDNLVFTRLRGRAEHGGSMVGRTGSFQRVVGVHQVGHIPLGEPGGQLLLATVVSQEAQHDAERDGQQYGRPYCLQELAAVLQPSAAPSLLTTRAQASCPSHALPSQALLTSTR